MDELHLQFLINVNSYISEKLYQLVNQMGPSNARDQIRGLQALTNAVANLFEEHTEK